MSNKNGQSSRRAFDGQSLKGVGLRKSQQQYVNTIENNNRAITTHHNTHIKTAT